MATVTIRPSAVSTTIIPSGGAATITGAANAYDAVNSPDSDADYLTFASSTAIAFTFGDPSIPANAKVQSITARVRHNNGVSGPRILLYGPSTTGGSTLAQLTGASSSSQWFSTAGTTVTQTLSALTALFDGSSLSIADTNSLECVITNPSYGGTFNVYEVYIDIVYNEAPTISSLAATSSTLHPYVTGNYADPESDVMERLKVKAFTAAQYGAGGFDPNTSTAAYDSGEVFVSSIAHEIPVDLVDGTTYRIWVQVADAGSGGRYNVITSGAGYVQITIAAPPTAVPSLTVTADPTNMRQALAIVGHENLLSSDDADFENGLGTWTSRLNCTVTTSTTQKLIGSVSMRLSSTASGNMAARTATGLSGYPVLPSTAYTFAAALRAASTGRTTRLTAYWYKSDGTASATATTSVVVSTDVNSSFTNHLATVTSPSDAAFAAIDVQVDSTGAGAELHYVDCAMIAPGTVTTWNRGGAIPTRHFQVQRSDDGGATWADLDRTPINGALTSYDLSTYTVSTTTQAVTVYDYEAHRGGTVPQYRVRSSATISGSTFSSAWVTVTSNSAMTNNGWWIKDVYDPTNNASFPMSSASLEWISVDRSAVYYPNGEANAIVLSDVPAGEQLAIDFYTWTDTGTAMLEAMRAGRNQLLVQSPYGDHLYCSFVRRRVMKQSPRPDGVRKPVVSIELAEVDAP